MNDVRPSRPPPSDPIAGAVFSLLAAAAILAAWLLERADGALFYQLTQEDGALEWATFWSFFLTGSIAARALLAASSAWARAYLALLALGCLFVALEEISWGQRVFAYQPPAGLLEDNFQQEANLHNLMPTELRQGAVLLLLLGFGVLWPLLGRVPALASWLRDRALATPSLSFLPGFALAAVVYVDYPWHNTGEWVELLAGFGLLLALLPWVDARLVVSLGAVAAMAALGLLTPRALPDLDDPERLAAAQQEVAALAADFERKRLRSRCGIHKRLYTFVEQYGARRMEESAFRADEGARRDFFLDPWQMPYWVRHHCEPGRGEVVFVYSFGADRRRDSSARELAGDDVGHYVRGP